MAANIDLFGVVGAAGKRRVDIHQINLDPRVLKISAGRQALPPQQQVVPAPAPGCLAHLFNLFHFVARHAPLDFFNHSVAVPVAQPALAVRRGQQGLPFYGVGQVGRVFNRHGFVLQQKIG